MESDVFSLGCGCKTSKGDRRLRNLFVNYTLYHVTEYCTVIGLHSRGRQGEHQYGNSPDHLPS